MGEFNARTIIKNIFQTKLYFIIYILTLLLIVLSMIITEKIIYPSFHNELMKNIIDESDKVAKHLAGEGLKDTKNPEFRGNIRKVIRDFNLEGIKLFDSKGYVLYSNITKEIGELNKHDYFHKKVAKGEIFYKIVEKGSKSLEGRVIPKDVAEIYIPYIEKNKFTGAFEIYYDITEKKKSINTLISNINRLNISIASTLFVFIFIMLYNASKNSIYKRIANKKILKFNEELKTEVEEKTKELQILNNNLEKKIKDEIEKNMQKEKILFHQSKLASMGELLGNIAHQWRQPLTAISVAASGIKLQKALDIELEEKYLDEAVELILKNSNEMSHIIDDFRNFYRTEKESSFFDIAKLIDNCLGIVSNNFKSCAIKIIKNYNSKLVYGIKNEFFQVLINLLNNARDALLENKELNKRVLFISTEENNNYLIIKVKDNAGGIDEKIIEKVFEPYFTTRHQAQGTGIGLYLTAQIIEKHFNGEISVSNHYFTYEDENCRGAEFIITIPLSEKS